MPTVARLLQRELRLVTRQPLDALLPLAFFAVVASLFPLAVGAEPEQLRRMGPGVLWIGALLASLLPLPALYGGDHQDGSLDQLLLPPHSALRLAVAKAAAHWLAQGLPLLLATPLLGLMFGLPAGALALLMLGLVLGTPVLSLLGGLAAALTLGLRQGALLNLLLVLPLAVPVLVFGCGAVAAHEAGLPAQAHLSLLAALLLATGLLAPPATAAALRLALT
jgi:heme exporter protein B